MEIIKELNLNGNPQITKNGSLTFAKNIRLSLDGSFITNDEGFKIGIITSYNGTPNLKVAGISAPLTVQTIEGNIVGYINCPNEIVILTSTHQIYRLVECENYDELCVVPVQTRWNYSNGKISGTYMYNANGELIIAIGESDTNINVPLKIINLNKGLIGYQNESLYTVAPNVPIVNLEFNGYKKGNIPCGLYYFFVRYKYNNIYTNWFPVGKSYQAINSNYKRLIYHTYNITENVRITNTNVYSTINEEGTSDYTFDFNLNLSSFNRGFSHIQLGYIIQSANGIVARSNEEFKLNSDVTDIPFVFNTINSKEISIDDIIRPVFRLNNVKCLTNFNNSLYIANYDEIDNTDNEYSVLSEYLDNNPITISQVNKFIVPKTDQTISINYSIELKLRGYDDTNHTNDIIDIPAFTITTNDNYKFTLNTVDNTAANYQESVKIADHLFIKCHKNGTSDVGIDKYDNGNLSTNYSKYLEYLNLVTLDFSNPGYVGIEKPEDIVGEVYYKLKESDNNNYYDLEVNPLSTSIQPNYININQLDISGSIITSNYTDNTRYDLSEEIRTFIPNESYNFYIHFIRQDGSYTDGLLINSQPFTFTIPNIGTWNNNNIPYFSVLFENATNPDSEVYSGYFISYSKVNPGYNVYIESVQGNIIYAKSTDYQLSLINVQNAKLKVLYNILKSNGKIYRNNTQAEFNINSIKAVLSNSISNIGAIQIDRRNIEGIIAIELDSSQQYDLSSITNVLSNGNNVIASVISNNTLNSDSVQLHYLGYNNMFSGDYEESNTIKFNSPGYLVYDKSIKFVNHIYTKEDNKIWKSNTIDFSNTDNLFDNIYADLLIFPRYSNFYLNAISIKKEPELIQAVYANSRIIENTIIEAANLSDLFQLKSDYIENVYKSYIQYDENKTYIDKFTNGIRNSFPIRTESVENSWRIFDAEDYYLIDKKAGEITNIFAIGKYFFIHTRNTLLIASADAKLTADNTTISVTNHKLFDVAPSELFTSDLGFGGLKYRECQILSQYGYIWYDSDHHKIFRYDNNKLEDLTAAVEEFISTHEPTHCYFNIDNRTNRIFMCFMKAGYSDEFTFAYSTLTNKFISFMDFGFDKNLHTTNKVFFSKSGIASIYKYDNTNFGLYGMLGPLDTNLQPVTESKAIFDILINVGPEIPKTLESIRWIHNYLDANNIDNNNYAELLPAYPMSKHTDRKYPEDKIYDLANVYLRIFNNNVDTEELSLFNDKLNRASIKKQGGSNYDDSYKYPHYEKGVWQFNYFRDVINKINDMYYSADGRDKSDIKSLIYGTYFVIRFIFKNSSNGGTTYNKRLKFDSISFKINNY